MAVRQEPFVSVGGFRTELGPGALGVGGEDILLGLMLADAGYPLVAALDAKVDHHVPTARFADEELRRRAVGGGRADGWITYHYHQSYYRFPLLRMAGFKAMSALAGRDRMKTYQYLHSYGLHQQIRREAGKPYAVAHPIKAARGSTAWTMSANHTRP